MGQLRQAVKGFLWNISSLRGKGDVTLTIGRDNQVSGSSSRRCGEVSVRLESAGAISLDDPNTVATEIRHVEGSIRPFDDLMQMGSILSFGVGRFFIFVGEVEFQNRRIRIFHQGVRLGILWEEDGRAPDVLRCQSRKRANS